MTALWSSWMVLSSRAWCDDLSLSSILMWPSRCSTAWLGSAPLSGNVEMNMVTSWGILYSWHKIYRGDCHPLPAGKKVAMAAKSRSYVHWEIGASRGKELLWKSFLPCLPESVWEVKTMQIMTSKAHRVLCAGVALVQGSQDLHLMQSRCEILVWTEQRPTNLFHDAFSSARIHQRTGHAYNKRRWC